MSSKCTECVQPVFRGNLCVDHFRKQAGPGKMASAESKGEDLSDAQKEKFRELTSRPYAEQAKWYLNAFFAFGAEEHAEEVWKTCLAFTELDKRHKSGNELNEVEAHHFLQSSGKTMTALELRNQLRRIDVDANGQMALLEYLLFQYEKGVKQCLTNPQGGGAKEQQQLAEAEATLEALSKTLAELQQEQAKAKEFEDALKKAEEDARAAADEFQRQEDEYKNKIATLEAKTQDASLGTVSRNKAVQELAGLKSEDPLPLRRAKITQEAAVRKVAKERAAAEAQTRVVDAKVETANAQCQEAQAQLEELKKQGGAPLGAIWWMEREVIEAKKYMPKKKQ